MYYGADTMGPCSHEFFVCDDCLNMACDRTLRNASIFGTLPPAIGNLSNLVTLWVEERPTNLLLFKF